MSSLRDLLKPRHEFRLANKKFPENFFINAFNLCVPYSVIKVSTKPKSIK